MSWVLSGDEFPLDISRPLTFIGKALKRLFNDFGLQKWLHIYLVLSLVSWLFI